MKFLTFQNIREAAEVCSREYRAHVVEAHVQGAGGGGRAQAVGVGRVHGSAAKLAANGKPQERDHAGPCHTWCENYVSHIPVIVILLDLVGIEIRRNGSSNEGHSSRSSVRERRTDRVSCSVEV